MAPGVGTDAGDEVAVIRDDGAADGTDGDLTTQIAMAPRNAAGRKVATLRELANDSALDVSASRVRRPEPPPLPVGATVMLRVMRMHGCAR